LHPLLAALGLRVAQSALQRLQILIGIQSKIPPSGIRAMAP